MLMALLAVVLFSTIMITVYNNLSAQAILAQSNIYYSQGIHIADMIFQQIEVNLISLKIDFSQIMEIADDAIGPDGWREYGDINIFNTNYRIFIMPVFSDMYGNPSVTSTDHIRVFTRMDIRLNENLPPSYQIGSDDFSYSKVFTNMRII
jgi:hypothetical protein